MVSQKNNATLNESNRLAVEHLQIKGYEILQRDYLCKWGEIDIVAKANNVVVFVEVNTKTSEKFDEPWEMVNAWKIEQIKTMGELWRREYGWAGKVRIDVLGVSTSEGEPKIEHWESVDS